MGRSRHGIIGPDDPSISYFSGVYSQFHRFIREYVDAIQPDKHNRYVYCYNNPVKLTDPLGLNSYVITYGEEDQIHKDQAEIIATQIQASDYYNSEVDTVNMYPVNSVSGIAEALSSYDYKAAWVYVGHANYQALFPSDDIREDANLTTEGGKFEAFGHTYEDSVSVSEMPTEGFIENAAIILAGCRTAVGEDNIAQGIANHFNLRTLGSESGVSWSSEGPVSTIERQIVDWMINIFEPGTGSLGGFKWVYPEKESQTEGSNEIKDQDNEDETSINR